jgi:hypothetical protein
VSLATAALMDLIGRGQAMQAAIIRGAGQDEIAVMRVQAHDVLDAYLDHTTQAAQAVRAIIEP